MFHIVSKYTYICNKGKHCGSTPSEKTSVFLDDTKKILPFATVDVSSLLIKIGTVMIDEHTRTFIREHAGDDVRQLALQAARYPQVDMRVAVTQIEGRRLATAKLPEWAAVDDIIYPVRLSMEQCSSETTARYKASLVDGSKLADLTGGFGIDCSYMAKNFEDTTYIERNDVLCHIAKHNFALLGLPIKVINGNSLEVLATLPQQDWILIDPARRDESGNKVVALNDCDPDVCRIEHTLLQKATMVMVKCSPMLDISLALSQLTSVSEVHAVSVNNECKELLFILNGNVNDTVSIHTMNFQGGCTQAFDFMIEEEQEAHCSYTATIGRYLYEPNSSMMKVGCFRLPTQRYNLMKLHPNTHLYTADILIPNFPGRVFEVKSIDGFGKNELKRISSGLKRANIAVRNFPDRPETLRKRLKLTDGGDTYLFATTLYNGKKAIICCTKATHVNLS